MSLELRYVSTSIWAHHSSVAVPSSLTDGEGPPGQAETGPEALLQSPCTSAQVRSHLHNVVAILHLERNVLPRHAMFLSDHPSLWSAGEAGDVSPDPLCSQRWTPLSLLGSGHSLSLTQLLCP